MCGIMGVIGTRPAAPVLMDALRRLEYRGYDSAGVATLVNGHIERRRAQGKLANLAAALERTPLPGTIGIGHTRWATHGVPTEGNAHPHGTERVSIVHNGIIENHAELRAELEAQGQEFSTETDTEAVAQLIDLHLQAAAWSRPLQRSAAFDRLEGAYALAMIFAGHPELIIGAQHGAPLAVGFGEEEMFVGSDALALAPLTRRIAYLDDGDWAVVDRRAPRFFDAEGARGRARGEADPADRRRNRQGQLPPLHGEGDARAAGGDRRHAPPHGRTRDASRGAAGSALRPRPRAADHDQRLRLRFLCRAGRALVVRGGRAHPGGGRCGERVPLSRPAVPQGGPGAPGQPVGRDRRHTGGATLHARAAAARALDHQRAGEQHGARVAMRCWRPWRVPRSGSPAPRPLPRSSRCWPASRSRRRAHAAILAPSRRRP